MDRSIDSFNAKRTLEVDGKTYHYFDLNAAAANGLGDISQLPFSLKVLLENLLRHEDGANITKKTIEGIREWLQNKTSTQEVAYYPARVLMQDFTGVPAVVDLAAMREAMERVGGDPKKINPLSPVDLVIDHSVMVDVAGSEEAFERNVALEFDRNGERYELLKWAQTAFDNFRVVPPGTGICHQVNLEYLARVVFTKESGGQNWAFPDTCVGTDSHTTMINGLSVLGWGVGGIEAEAAMLAQPVTMVIPEVVGFKLTGSLKEGTTATDLVLTVTQMLRERGVVGKFVEFYGPGLDNLSLADQATIANMAPEYGATCGFFPIDSDTVDYLRFSGRNEHQVKLVESYAKAQGMWRDASSPEPAFTDTLALDMGAVEPAIAGPKRPQDRIQVATAATTFDDHLASEFQVAKGDFDKKVEVAGADFALEHGAVVIAAITSCTNTSNPSVMLAAGLVAKNALAKGLRVKPWVKTSLAPGSQVVTDYLEAASLQDPLDQLGFNLVGYGCTTCIGNSGPLPDNIAAAIQQGDLVTCGTLSGNRNFEGRVSPHTRANYLMSPPLVVTYALAGNMRINLMQDPIGQGSDGQPVFLQDIWPTTEQIRKTLKDSLTPQMFKQRYGNVAQGPKQWQAVNTSEGFTFRWNPDSTYVRNPPFFDGMGQELPKTENIRGARPLAILGDNTTTDHISPAGAIKEDSPAGAYLKGHNVARAQFNSFGSRRGNHEVMMRGTFANIRIRNEMMPGIEGGVTRYMPDDQQMPIYDAAMKYQQNDVPLVVIGGKEYGMGSSRDWAAKGTLLLGVRAVICESFERIHRSNLIGMGVLPLEFTNGENRVSHSLDGSETLDVEGVTELKPRDRLKCTIHRADGSSQSCELLCRIDTEDELAYFKNGGILQYVIRKLAEG